MGRSGTRRAGGGPRPARAGAGLIGMLVGGTIAVCGLGMLACAAVGAAGDGRAVAALAVPGAAALALGLVMLLAAGREQASALTIPPAIGFGAVTLAWLAAAGFGAVPFLWAATFGSPLDAVFEAMSGFTTTGATLLSDIESEPDGILMWRQLSQWLGGVGIVVLVVAVAPIAAPGLQRAFFAEISGVTSDRLTPRIIDTAKIIIGIYLALTALFGLAYLIAGMSPFDAVAHTFTTVATGGFSPRNESIAAFDSVPIELIAIFGMTAGAVNFAIYWRLIRGGSIRPQIAELRAFFVVIAGLTAVVTASLLIAGDLDRFWPSLREAGFSIVSIGTTTGYTTADFDAWNNFARGIFLLLFAVGACAGSTAGGVKVIRLMLISKSAVQEIDRQLRPRAVKVLRVGGKPFSEGARRTVMGFMMIWLGIYVLGFLAMAACGLDFLTAAAAVGATLGVIGPGLGEVGATDNFAAVPGFGRAVAVALMLIGRLEVFTVVALLFGIARSGRQALARA